MADVASKCPPSKAPVDFAPSPPPPSPPLLGKTQGETKNICAAHENQQREQGIPGPGEHGRHGSVAGAKERGSELIWP